MAKRDRRNVPVAASSAAKAPEASPFEALSARRKFNVIGKKAGDVKNVMKARTQAHKKVWTAQLDATHYRHGFRSCHIMLQHPPASMTQV